MNSIEAVENIYPAARITEFSKSTKDHNLVQTLRSDAMKLCREKIAPNYIKKAFSKFTKGLLLNDSETGRRYGFIIWKEHNKSKITPQDNLIEYNYIDVLLICARENSKVGPVMLFEAEKYCLHNNMQLIELEPSDHGLVDYYKRYGYTVSVQRPFEILMSKTISPITVKKCNKTRKATKVKTFTDIPNNDI